MSILKSIFKFALNVLFAFAFCIAIIFTIPILVFGLLVLGTVKSKDDINAMTDNLKMKIAELKAEFEVRKAEKAKAAGQADG